MTRTSWITLVLVGAGAAAGLGVTCGPGGPTPSSETCQAGAPQGTVTAVDVGRFDGETFVAYGDGDVAPLVYGGQGFPMLVVNLRLRGSDLPACVPQRTQVRLGDGTIDGSEEAPLVTRQVLPDTWITGDALLIVFGVSEGQQVAIEAEVGGASTSVDVWVGYEGVLPDAAVPDAAVPDAPVLPDAAIDDAAAPDASN